MSRIGKLPISVPQGVSVNVTGGVTVTVEGKKGKLSYTVPQEIKLLHDDSVLKVVIAQDSKVANAMWGLSRSLIANMVKGVSEGFEKKLEINGVGYKASMSGRLLMMSIGYSNDVVYAIPDDVEVRCEKQEVVISGADKQKVGQIAADIRSIRPPEPYKGKGIKYKEELIIRKKGKKK
ncbi:50S ribosomal subunit protein L6 [Alphaproteobacteria bacterium]